jgi:peptidyl-prolyl cis-trans isomerase C
MTFPALAAGALAVLAASMTQAEDDRVVARVGSETIGLRDVAATVRAVPLHQLSGLGDDGPAIARALVDRMVRASLMAQGAQAEGIADEPARRDRIRSILASALLHDVRAQAAAEAVSDEEVKAFYEQNRDRYAPQRRLRIFQITVDSRAKAEALLNTIASDADYQKDPVGGWEKLAREQSIDQTTNMRAGDLGFVHPDGSTRQKDVTVPKPIYEAAAKVRDGEIVPEPVKVGDHWLVIQRRGTVDTPERPLEDEAPTIRALLARDKHEAATKELLAKLRQDHVSETSPELVERIAIDPEGDLSPVVRPNTLNQPRKGQPNKASGPARPLGPPGDLR